MDEKETKNERKRLKEKTKMNERKSMKKWKKNNESWMKDTEWKRQKEGHFPSFLSNTEFHFFCFFYLILEHLSISFRSFFFVFFHFHSFSIFPPHQYPFFYSFSFVFPNVFNFANHIKFFTKKKKNKTQDNAK